MLLFLSTLSLRRATNCRFHARTGRAISIHALLAESDVTIANNSLPRNDFYPRSPCGERLVDTSKDTIKATNFYPRSPCGERRRDDTSRSAGRCISIHALLAESDKDNADTVKAYAQFLSTLSLRRATTPHYSMTLKCQFLSTLSLRRATRGTGWIQRHRDDFYPRSPCGERPAPRRGISACHHISIHALLAESDIYCHLLRTSYSKFLSTLSLRRATRGPHCYPPRSHISIHALLAESDAAGGAE